jgi:hypothetical protein
MAWEINEQRINSTVWRDRERGRWAVSFNREGRPQEPRGQGQATKIGAMEAHGDILRAAKKHAKELREAEGRASMVAGEIIESEQDR